MRHSARLLVRLSIVAAAGLPSAALAQSTFPCGHQGRLIWLGTSADGSQSVWLSSITTSFTGDRYALYGAVPPFPAGTTPVDEWGGKDVIGVIRSDAFAQSGTYAGVRARASATRSSKRARLIGASGRATSTSGKVDSRSGSCFELPCATGGSRRVIEGEEI